MKVTTILDKFLTHILISYFQLFKSKEIIIGKNIWISGKPLIQIRKNCKLIIGENVLLNSRNSGYHLNMFAPVKLMADRKGEIIIGNNTRIHGVCIHSYSKISIGSNCLIAANTNIIDGNGHDLSFDNPSNRINTLGCAKEIVIGDDVWIGANCFILPGTTIGNGTVISAGSVVSGDIPSLSLAGGNPVKIFRTFENMDERYSDFIKS